MDSTFRFPDKRLSMSSTVQNTDASAQIFHRPRRALALTLALSFVLPLSFNVQPAFATTGDSLRGTVERDESLDGIKHTLANETTLTNVILGAGTDSSSRNLVWFTDAAHSGAPVVELIATDQLVDGSFPAEGAIRFDRDNGIRSELAGQTNSRGFEAYSNKVEFAGLEADTAYTYRIGNGDIWLGQWNFTTEKQTDEWSFFFIGDPQIGAESGHKGHNPMERSYQADTWGWNETLKLATETFPEVRTIVSAGDQVESDRKSTPNSSWNQTEKEYLGYSYPEALQTLQSAPTLGNHDYYDGGRDTYQQHYNIPNFDPETWNHWWVQNNVLFLHLNTEFNDPEKHRDLHDAWLTKVLEEQGDKYRHHVAVFHRPLYSTGTTHSTSPTTERVRSTFTPLLQKHNISIILTGHDHSYARSHVLEDYNPGTYNHVTKSWDGSTGKIVDLGSYEDAPREVFLEDNQLVSLVANSASGSKYYDLVQPKHPFLAVNNQEFVRNYSVIGIDNCSVTYRTFRAEANDKHEANSVVDEVRVNVPNARPTLEQNPSPITVSQDKLETLDLTTDLDYTVCDAEKFPIEVEGAIDESKTGVEQTVTLTIAKGTAWEVSTERTVTILPASEGGSDGGTDDEATVKPSPTAEDDTAASPAPGSGKKTSAEANGDNALANTGAQELTPLAGYAVLLLIVGTLTATFARRRGSKA